MVDSQEKDSLYFPKIESKYWDLQRETMKEKERNKVILKKLKDQLWYAYNNSPYYHNLYNKISLDINSIKSLADFARKVPITTKSQVMEEQRKNPPFGDFLTGSIQDTRLVLASSGTTGKPTYIPFSGTDLNIISEDFARIMWSFGVRPGMKLMNAASFSYYAGSWGVMLGSQRLGLTIIPTGAGSQGITLNAIKAARDFKPEIIYSTPSYLYHLAIEAENFGVDPKKDFNFRIIFGSGEPGFSIEAQINRIKEIFGEDVKIVDAGTMVEAMPWISSCGCGESTGTHLWQDVVYTELLKLDSDGTELVDTGEEGVLTYTPLNRKLYPLIRYFSGDVSLVSNEQCVCGRTYPLLSKGIYARNDDMIVIKGIKTWPIIIEESLSKSKWYNGEFRVLIENDRGLDQILINVEITQEAQERIISNNVAEEDVKKELRTFLREGIGVTAEIDLKPPNFYERSTHKTRRIEDRRKLYEEISRTKK